MMLMTLTGEEEHCPPSGSTMSWLGLFEVIGMTTIMSLLFVAGKEACDRLRSRYCRLTVVVLGAGPIGLLSVLLTLRSRRASRLIIYEERQQVDLFSKTHSIVLDARSVAFVRSLGIRLPSAAELNQTESSSRSSSLTGRSNQIIISGNVTLAEKLHAADDNVYALPNKTNNGQQKTDSNARKRSSVTNKPNAANIKRVGEGVEEKGAVEKEGERERLKLLRKGSWFDDKYHTCIGDFLALLLQTINDQNEENIVELRFGCKFVRSSLEELETMPDRLLAIVCDGASGRSASLLGLSDEFLHVSCKAYGAVADIERLPRTLHPSSQQTYNVDAADEPVTSSRSTWGRRAEPTFNKLYYQIAMCNTPVSTRNTAALPCNKLIDIDQNMDDDDLAEGEDGERTSMTTRYDVRCDISGNDFNFEEDEAKCCVNLSVQPTADRLIHGITFDLSAHGKDFTSGFDTGSSLPKAFQLKIFGSLRHRFMALAVPRCESDIVRSLKTSIDQSMMKSIFQTCFNAYKSEEDAPIEDAEAATQLKCSARLYDIKLSQRRENVAYIEDANVFVVTEGDAARHCNFRTGLDINLAIRGLFSLDTFVNEAACADSDAAILTALRSKYQHHQQVCQHYISHGLRNTMYPRASITPSPPSSNGKVAVAPASVASDRSTFATASAAAISMRQRKRSTVCVDNSPQ